MPIRKKLTLWYAGIMIIVTMVIGSAATATMYLTLVGSIDTTLEQTAEEVIANSSSFPVREFGGGEQISVHIAPLDTFRASGIYVQVWQTWQGMEHIEPLYADGSSNLEDYRLPLDRGTVDSSAIVYSYTSINNTPFRVYTRPIILDQGTQFGTVQVAASLQTVRQAIDRLLLIMIFGGMISLLVALALGMMISRVALRPIAQITEATASIADTEDLRTRLTWNGPHDEIGDLASVFNHMMERLEHLFSVQQRFVADVSHELRTPLTAIRGNLEIIKRYGMDSESLEAIDSEVGRMSRMVNDLLLLARADYGGIKIELFPVDLDTVVSEAYREAKMLAKDRDLQVKIEEFQPVRVNGNADRLKQLLLNLVGNAIKFTPDGGKITLGLSEKDERAYITVRDTGIGIAPDDLERIFDRFYQVDSARTHTGGGAGLGLAIAKWIAEAHGGSIRAESEVGKGTTFIITLPVLEAVNRVKAHERPTRRSLRLPFRGEERKQEQPSN
ncbi:MAG: HAMP domain-containing histidine kinase [Chloroflexi bacterium]|nr:HAMP domain-containing histidine kinase [Chloroflexota bacterium]